ncbi:GNAT family N-acetyltransferase [Paenibacillus sp. NPDC058071]|uniref:GNAT family N-acetyltransferase n=1 Tax=Paenibacillus sp. NPDC058071 TaxID=3346326 RepID=UPI0036DD4A73
MTNFSISIGNEEEGEWIRSQLLAYNAKHAPTVYVPIVLKAIDDEGRIVGGLNAVHLWNWIEVNILWIDEQFRGQGIGAQLLAQIEEKAKEWNCDYIKLNTFTFQAPNYYPKLGYKEYAVIPNLPPGFSHHFFIKELTEQLKPIITDRYNK